MSDNNQLFKDFIAAIRAGHHAKLKGFVKQGVDVNYTPEFEMPAIAAAAEEGKIKCISELIKLGADINKKSHSGETALLRAARNGKPDCLKLLLESGADIHATSKLGENVLYKVVDGSKNKAMESLKILFCFPVTDCLTTSGKNALDRALERDMEDEAVMIKSHFENQALISLIKEEPKDDETEEASFSF